MDLQFLCDAIGQCKSRAEHIQVDSQAIFVLDEEEREKVDNFYNNAVTDATTGVQEMYEKEKAELSAAEAASAEDPSWKALEEVLGKPVAEVKGELLEKKRSFLTAKEVVRQM